MIKFEFLLSLIYRYTLTIQEKELADARQAWREEREREIALEDETLLAGNVYRLANEHHPQAMKEDKGEDGEKFHVHLPRKQLSYQCHSYLLNVYFFALKRGS